MGDNNDPYRDGKLYHLANLVGLDGSVSALCFIRPHAINLARERWTLDRARVTCPKCLKAISHGKPPTAGEGGGA